LHQPILSQPTTCLQLLNLAACRPGHIPGPTGAHIIRTSRFFPTLPQAVLARTPLAIPRTFLD
jgi:hypothetical protein